MRALLLTIKYKEYYVPLDLGYVKAYCDSINNKNKIVIDSCSLNNPLTKTISQIYKNKPNLIVFFLDNIMSSQVFSLGYALKLFNEIKKNNKSIYLCIQSYKINQEFSKRILTENNCIDIIIIGEPEMTINDLLNFKSLGEIEGISFRDNNKITINKERELIHNLNILPSPYITRSIEKELYLKKNYAMISTSRGCLFRCFYCFRSTKFPLLRTFSTERVLNEIKYLISKGIKKIYIIDDCFIVNKRRFHDLADAISKINSANIKFDLMCRYEFLDKEDIKRLKKMNVKSVQIGLQTTNPKLIKTFNSNFNEQKFDLCLKQLQKNKIYVIVDLIMGLPGDSFKDFKSSFDYLIKIKPDLIRIHRLFIHPNTYLDINKEKLKINLVEKRSEYKLPVIKSNYSLSYYDLLKAMNYIKLKRKSMNIEFYF
jgi:radical SAM superfamily enzyme YgiQ (UPF0313 family)